MNTKPQIGVLRWTRGLVMLAAILIASLGVWWLCSPTPAPSANAGYVADPGDDVLLDADEEWLRVVATVQGSPSPTYTADSRLLVVENSAGIRKTIPASIVRRVRRR